MIRSMIRLFATAAAYFYPMGKTALAHHLMGNQVPTNALEGLVSGLGHPIIGPDHLAAIVAVGYLASTQRRPALGVVGFVVFMLVGAFLHVGSATFPGVDVLVSLTVAGLGVALTLVHQKAFGLVLLLFSLTGLFHGYALAESIIGAQPDPVVSYLIGLAAIQSAIGLALAAGFRLLLTETRRALPVQFGGALLVGIGLLSFIQQLMSSA